MKNLVWAVGLLCGTAMVLLGEMMYTQGAGALLVLGCFAMAAHEK